VRPSPTLGGPDAREHRGISQQETLMTESKRGRGQDRAKVAGGQTHEVKYESGKTGASRGEVREAVKNVGNSRQKVEGELRGKK
jgi:hypothetical protein